MEDVRPEVDALAGDLPERRRGDRDVAAGQAAQVEAANDGDGAPRVVVRRSERDGHDPDIHARRSEPRIDLSRRLLGATRADRRVVVAPAEHAQVLVAGRRLQAVGHAMRAYGRSSDDLASSSCRRGRARGPPHRRRRAVPRRGTLDRCGRHRLPPPPPGLRRLRLRQPLVGPHRRRGPRGRRDLLAPRTAWERDTSSSGCSRTWRPTCTCSSTATPPTTCRARPPCSTSSWTSSSTWSSRQSGSGTRAASGAGTRSATARSTLSTVDSSGRAAATCSPATERSRDDW